MYFTVSVVVVFDREVEPYGLLKNKSLAERISQASDFRTLCSKSIYIYKSCGEHFLLNRNCDFGWFWANWQYLKISEVDNEKHLSAVFICLHAQKD